MKLLVVIVTLLYVSQHALGVEVEVTEGVESVVLPCQVTVTDAQPKSVLWSVERLSDKIVHLRGPSGDKLTNQNQDYASRTSMRTDSLTTGDLSLTLKNPTVRDSETYTCIYREKGLDKSLQEVQLEVKERPPDPRVIGGGVAGGFLVLLAVAAGGFIWFVKTDGKRVLQVKVEEGKQSVLLSLRWTDTWWVRMKMKMCCICGDLPEVVRVEWVDIRSRKLHVYENGSDQPGEQDQRYRGRTEMKTGDTGDYRLTLMKPRLKDTGVYYCRVYNLNGVLLRVRRVYLEVTVLQVEVKKGKQSVLLPFRWTVTCWLRMKMFLCRICCTCCTRCSCCTKPDQSKVVRVEWVDRCSRKLHVYDNGSDQPGEQDEHYRDRTEMKKDLKTGDYSLTLMKPTVTDTGDYTCRVYDKDGVLLRERTVRLWVEVQQVEVKAGAESVLLSFKITPGLPGDVRVEWWDSYGRKVHVYQNGSVEQDQVYRGRTEMDEDLKTGDYSLILMKPTVTDRGGYTCRVYDKDGVLLRERTVRLWVEGQHVLEKEGEESVLLPTPDLPRGGIDKTFHLHDLQVEEGEESVQLSFQTTADLSEDVRVQCTDEGNRKVYEYQNGSVEQDKVYRGRTEMKKEFSLILKHPKETDSGRYTCRVYNKAGNVLSEAEMGLKVKGKNKPATPGREEDPLMAEDMV